MDVAAYLQRFESSINTYVGDDPLEQWDKFVELLERKLPPNDTSQLSLVFNRLVETFLNEDKYANDQRYVNYCIKCASTYPDPIALYSHIFSKGVGTRSTALYVCWAQQLEQRGMNDQAEAVYQKALENQAQPAEPLLHEYRQFQSRTKCHVTALGSRNPLQNSHSANVMSTHREPSASNKQSTAVDCQPAKPAERKYVIMISRSEYSGKIPPSSNDNTVAAYDKEALQFDGSELCFEEVRAQRYFQKLQAQQEQKQEEAQSQATIAFEGEETQDVNFWMKFKMALDTVEHISDLTTSVSSVTDAHHPLVHQRPPAHPGSKKSLGFKLHSEPKVIADAPRSSGSDSQMDINASTYGQSLPAPITQVPQQVPVPAASVTNEALLSVANLSHHAPLPPATMSHHAPVSDANIYHHAPALNASVSHHEPIIPQRTSDHCPPENDNEDNEEVCDAEQEVNDVIMDMFQAPTLLEDPFPNASEERDFDVIYTRKGPSVVPATSAPFTIFEDNDEQIENKENCSAPPAVSEKVKPVRTLAELPKATKPNDTPTELTPDESTMWGAHFHAQNSLAACPNSTSDFAMLARFVSTPFTHKTPVSTTNFYFPDQEVGVAPSKMLSPFTKKLSPIMEQSPSEEKLNDTAVTQQSLGARQGTIVGEGVAMNTQLLANSCTTMVQPAPPAVLSFRDQTICPSNTSVHRSTGPGWEVYTSPKPKPEHEPFTIMEDKEEPLCALGPPTQDVPMSPESAPRPDWLTIQSPEVSEERDLDAFLSPHHPRAPCVTHTSLHTSQDVPMSPQVECHTDCEMMSPYKEARAPLDVSMKSGNPRTDRANPGMTLMSDPWNEELIGHLLGSMDPPLTAHPHCVTWQCNLPNIAPKMTLSMGNSSLRVDCVLGEGAFAKVYQATDPMSSDKMVLKVQKPANPWEFYINTQLDARIPQSVRHFYSSFHSAHFFKNGSVLLGEMHNYGTLLNAVNMYRTLGDKVMPQPLVLYFSVCILHMIEQLHSVGIIHADVKPDNFLLGERFLEKRSFDGENLDHGLVLIDLGQSIDMRLFPQGTAFTAKCLTSGFQCTEMQTGRPWNYQTDYFGVAGTVYCMLFGTYMQVVNDDGIWRTNGVFRRNPHSDLWQQFFHTLLNVPDCNSVPDLRGLRQQLLSVLEQNYSSKLASLKSRLVVLLLENSRNNQRR
ncbi:hypothetical protein NQD34_017653 [Periophthalmus magnuspinnatus]|nr:hypothetical protein NQD34_017653 [Periophthalmus magnuspinnatus]